ncbi:uncharacterized protein LOC112575226 isoform X2 [Pomacea canaliculata]|uniref:uncharacterized protein LOC112575226 isoform X2 n=1 Tax=Pomacea canaliculata TaxID=400727 RepID=UPI000D736753|nr:uncharacterized protein LOC112575226 isoform X2 [Pomacea canaliculata]
MVLSICFDVWRQFGQPTERINAIQTIINGITASRLKLTADFEAEHLMTVIKPLFTGRLSLGETFLTRGLGLSKKAVKHDCFTRGLEILKTKSVEEIMALEDCGVEALKEEVLQQSKEDYDAFKKFIYEKHASESDTSEKIRTAAISTVRSTEWHFPLADKIMMFAKEVEKPGMEDVPLISRFDVTSFKVGITVTVVYRLEQVPQVAEDQAPKTACGQDQNLLVNCHIYFDDTLVGKGCAKSRKEAQKLAYENLQNRLCSESFAAIAAGPKIPENPSSLPDFLDVVYKGAKPQQGSNSHKLSLMKLHPPDPNADPDDIVIMESEGDNLEENAFKVLEFSATKNGMLLSWRQLDKGNAPGSFRCEMILQNTKKVVGVSTSKTKARNAAAALMLVDMYQNQDVVKISLPDNEAGKISYKEIEERARELKAEGPYRSERVDCDLTVPDERAEEKCKAVNRQKAGAQQSDKAAGSQTWDKPDTELKQWLDNELRPWLEDAIVERIEKYTSKLTLEELVFEFPRSARRFALAAAQSFYLVTGARGSQDQGFWPGARHRGHTPQEMVKILHVNKGKSGRYQIIFANKPFSAAQQADFVRRFPAIHKARAKAMAERERQRKDFGSGDLREERENLKEVETEED